MAENLSKLLLYFKKWDNYWKLTDERNDLVIPPGKLGRYPLDFKDRVEGGHYTDFDETGIPMRYYPGTNKLVYKYTTMCSYALGQSDYYLITGDSRHLERVLSVADYIVKSCIEGNDFVLLKESDCDGKHRGNISAMIQGEAMSVLCRASYFTDREIYLDLAKKLIPPFEDTVENGGVVGIISKTGLPWYEEYVTLPLNHVLNGMIYSLWGLRDIYLFTGDNNANELFNNGVEYVENTLPLFDSGYWSYYWVSEGGRNYTASMMYHNLHICQLTALHRQTDRQKFLLYAEKFKKYTSNFVNRFKAGKEIAYAKLHSARGK